MKDKETGKVSSEAPFDRAAATAYVRDLFEYVLQRKSTDEEELRYWTDYLVARQNPVEVFQLFATSEENKARRRLAEENREGFPAGHFYSPIVNVDEVEQQKEVIFRARELAEIDLNLEGQERIFSRLCTHSGTLPFTDQPDQSSFRYHYNNTSYGFGDAFVYWGMLREFRPRRIIEIGSGFTSALALDAIDILGIETECTFIDPYPDLLKKVAAPLSSRHTIIQGRVQELTPTIVDDLQANDFLFIDSSHVVKTGSDVHFELFELLPRLRPGVLVHFHDAFFPFEYPPTWVLNERKSWNELYFLRAFLMYNAVFKIVYFNHCFVSLRRNKLLQLPIEVGRRLFLNPGGGLWLQKVP
jgi:hypothetical protein